VHQIQSKNPKKFSKKVTIANHHTIGMLLMYRLLLPDDRLDTSLTASSATAASRASLDRCNSHQVKPTLHNTALLFHWRIRIVAKWHSKILKKSNYKF